MTIVYLHLVRLHPPLPLGSSPALFVQQIQQHSVSYRYKVVLASQARQWVVTPGHVDKAAVDKTWDVMLVLQPPSDAEAHYAVLPNSLAYAVADSYSVKCAIPSKLLAAYTHTSAQLNADAATARGASQFGPKRLQELRARGTTSDSQHLEASAELLDFAGRIMRDGEDRPVTMLNLLKFNEGEPGRESYKRYGQGFSADVGAKRGGSPKIVGRTLDSAWDEVAIVHYPNIVAFCDMASGDDYQALNQKFRLPALKDTLLLCTTEYTLGQPAGDSKL